MLKFTILKSSLHYKVVFVYKRSWYPEGPCIRNTVVLLVTCFISNHTGPLYFLFLLMQKPEPGENPHSLAEIIM